MKSREAIWRSLRMVAAVVAAFAILATGVIAVPSLAATVALTGTHMAAQSGGNKPAVTHFTSHTSTVYFDYTVVTPSQGDTGVVKVLAGGANGKVVASANLIFGVAASLYAQLKPASGAWPDGSYCSVLYIDGAQSNLNGKMPIGWSVGSSTTPGCKAVKVRPMYLTVKGHLHKNIRGKLKAIVKGKHHPLNRALVTLKGKHVGIKKMTGYTNSKGVYIFKKLLAKRKGVITVIASKAGYQTVKTKVTVTS